jgi:tetratricopeptide (TPR) repeat protein
MAICLAAPPAGAQLGPADVKAGLELMYGGQPDAAISAARELQARDPAHPLGFLLEANAMWWKMYCAACEVKWNTLDAWQRGKAPGDDDYLRLSDRAIALAEAHIARQNRAPMRLYAGMGYALKARLHGLRFEKLPTARTGKKAREHFLRAVELDPALADAYTGLGLYNYFADTLSVFVKMLRFFMGIPGGDKETGKRQLERAIREGEMTAVEARFYLAKNLRNYEQNYARGVELMEPLVKQYPHNPVFLLLLAELHAKLGHAQDAAGLYRAARALDVPDAVCAARVRQLSDAALAGLKPDATAN